MTTDQWFYHVAYTCATSTGQVFGDTTLWMKGRINSDDTMAEIRDELARLADRDSSMRTSKPVITSITLLAEPDEVQA